MNTSPGYWMHEQSGVLRPVVERYLDGESLSADEISYMRAYIRQWMEGDFRGEDAIALRGRVDSIVDMASLEAWLEDAVDAGIDPL